MFVAWENIVCSLKCPSLKAKIGKTKKSKLGRIDSRCSLATPTFIVENNCQLKDNSPKGFFKKMTDVLTYWGEGKTLTRMPGGGSVNFNLKIFPFVKNCLLTKVMRVIDTKDLRKTFFWNLWIPFNFNFRLKIFAMTFW